MVYGYEPFVVTTCPPTARMTNGVVLCRVNSWLTGRRLVSLPFSDHCAPLISDLNDLQPLLFHLQHRVDVEAWRYFEIRPIRFDPVCRMKLGQTMKYCFHSLDLSPTIDQLFHKFHKDCVQRKIRRAEREKLVYEEGTSERLLQKFYRLFTLTRRRQYIPPQPLSWFRGLINTFGRDLKIRVASKEGVAVASILTLAGRRSLVYKYGCSDVVFSKLGGTALLFWNAIQEAKSAGLEEFDMGRSDIDNHGLIAFKEHWGAVAKAITYWSYPPRKIATESEWRRRVVRRVVSVTPDVALRAVGALLYKHIG